MDNEEEDEVIFGQAASEICKENLGAMLIVRDNNMFILSGGKDIKPHCMSSFYRSFLTSRAANKLTGVLY